MQAPGAVATSLPLPDPRKRGPSDNAPGRPCNDERQRQTRDQACQRVRSGLTLPVERGCGRFSVLTTRACPLRVNPIEDEEARIHAAFHELISGQLRFLGSCRQQGSDTVEIGQSRDAGGQPGQAQAAALTLRVTQATENQSQNA